MFCSVLSGHVNGDHTNETYKRMMICKSFTLYLHQLLREKIISEIFFCWVAVFIIFYVFFLFQKDINVYNVQNKGKKIKELSLCKTGHKNYVGRSAAASKFSHECCAWLQRRQFTIKRTTCMQCQLGVIFKLLGMNVVTNSRTVIYVE